MWSFTMKIETDKCLYICSVVCGLLFVYFTSVYILLVILVFVLYLYYVSDPSTSVKLRTQKQLSSLWNSSSFLTSFDSMYQQNSVTTCRLNGNRTFNNARRSTANTRSFRESDAENTSFGTYRSEYDSRSFTYRSSDEATFSNGKMRSPRSFNTTRHSTTPDSPWGVSVSPKLRNRTSGVRTVQTVAGPLLASTRFNRSFDSGLLGNVSSPGLSSRIAHSARENAEVLTHQKKYNRPGDFPLVQLDRSATRLPTLSPRNTYKLSRTPVTVRIAPPESSDLRYSALLDRSPQSLGGIDHDTSPTADQSTKSLLEVLKEISRKRIHAQMEENEDEVKKQCIGETSLANGESQSRLTPVLNDVTGCKRMREESPEEGNVDQVNRQSRKRINNNEISSSLSSSRNLLKFMKKSAKKRKSTAELLANCAPVPKKQSRYESSSEPVSLSTSEGAPDSDKHNTSLAATLNSSGGRFTTTATSSPTEMHDSGKFPGIMKNFEKSSPKFLVDEQISEQRMKRLLESIEKEEKKQEPTRFSLSRAPTLPVRKLSLFSGEKLVGSTSITSNDSKTSNIEIKDSNISITKFPSSADVSTLLSSAPTTILHNTSTTSDASVIQTSTTQSAASTTPVQSSSPFSGLTSPTLVASTASASIIQTSTTQSTGSTTSVQSSSPFSILTSPTLVASSFDTSPKTSVAQSTASNGQPTTKTDTNISPGFVSSTSNVNLQNFSISLPNTSINFGATQTTAAIPNSLPSVKSSVFATSSAEQPIQASSFGSNTNAPSNQESAAQVSTALSNSDKSAEVLKPSSPQLIFGAVSSAKDTTANGSSQVQSSQAATLFGSSQVQPKHANSIFGSSPLAQSTQFTTSAQVQSTQASMAFGSSPSTQSNQVFPASNNSSTKATTESGSTASLPSAQSKSLFSVPKTSQQTSAGGVFSSVQSSALFGTSSPSSSSPLQPQTTVSFGGSATPEAAQTTNIFGSKQTDLFKTSSTNQSAQGVKLFGTSTSATLQPAQTATVFATPSVSTTTQTPVFGSSGTTQTTAASNVFASNSAVSSAQSEVKFATNAQPSTTLQSKSTFVLPSSSITFGSSQSPAQNTGCFQIAKPTSESDSGVGTSATSTASLGFGSVSSKPSPAQNTFSFGGATPSSAAPQTTSVFGTSTSQATPKSSAQTSLGFGASTSQSGGTFSAPQTGAVISGGFGAFSGSLSKTTSESNAATGKNIFASAASSNTTGNNTSVFGTQSTNAINVFGGAKTEEKPAPFGFGTTKQSDSSTNIFQANITSNLGGTKTDEKPAPFGFGGAKQNDSSTNVFQSKPTSNQSNAGGFKFDFTSSATSKENTAGTSGGQTTTPAFQFGTPGESKPTFGFGAASSISNTLKPAAGGFGSNLFGSTPTTTSSTTPQSNLFAFGSTSNPNSGPASSTSNAFGFGAASSAPSTSGAFTFASASQPSSSNVFGFGSAQTTTSTAQNATGGGGLFNTGSTPAFNTGTTPSFSTGTTPVFNTGTTPAFNTGSTPSFNTGTTPAFNTGTTPTFNTGATPAFNTGATPTFQFGNASSQAGSAGSFTFGSTGSPATPLNFTAGPSSSSSTFQPGTSGSMFSIGSGSTGPRARTSRTRRQR